MTLRLGSPSDPAWHDLELGGARLQVRPYDAVFETAGLHATIRAMRAFKEDTDGPNVEIAALVAIAQLAIADWDGITDPDGQPAPCTPDRVEHLIRRTPGAAIAFRRVWRRHMALQSAEGNGSGASPNGISSPAEAPPSAHPAEPSRPPATIDGEAVSDRVGDPAPSVPMMPSGPEASRPGPSGDSSSGSPARSDGSA